MVKPAAPAVDTWSMDDLKAVWGPDGLATTDPQSIRTSDPGPFVERETNGDAPSSGASRAPISDVGGYAVGNLHRSSPARRQRRLSLAATVGAAAALMIVLVASASVFGTRRPSGVGAGGGAAEAASDRWATATTIVSAAANLLPGGEDGPGGGSEGSAGSSTTVTTEPPASAAASAARRSTDLAGAEHRARQFVEAIERRDCDGLWSHLSSRTRTLLSASNEPGDPSGRELLCQGLDTEEVPAMFVRGPARTWGNGGAIVTLESEGEVEDLYLVFEDGAWFVDLLGSMESPESPDEDSMDRRRTSATSDEVKSDLRNALAAELTLFTEAERFTDDVDELDAVEPTLVWRRGVAPPSATPGHVYVALADDARVV